MNLRKVLRQYYLTSSLLIAVCTFGTAIEPVRAEGSRDLFPSDAPANANRGNILWRGDSAGGSKRRTLLRVFANQGEYILVGSSAVGVGSGNIEIYDPGTVTGAAGNESIPSTANADFVCSSQRTGQPSGTGNGFIANRTQELAGPQSIDGTGNTNGYTPCDYQAPTTGIYYVAIYGPSGKNNNTDSPNQGVEPDISQVNTGTNQNTGISAWDVTVRDSVSSTTDLNGRLHTYFINMNLGANGRQLYSDLYPITIDGYRYQIDLNGLDPFGFRIFGNLLGNLDSDGESPLYHDVIGTNGSIDNPEGGTSSAPPQFPIFFNQLDDEVLSYLQVYDPLTGLEIGTGFAASPITPVVSTPTYSGNVSGNKSTVNQGGTFSFESNISGVYEIIISRDGVDFDPTTLENRVMRGLMSSGGTQTVEWDGLDNAGEPFPVGDFNYRVQVHAGEYHFPISDAENNFYGGPTYTLLNGTNPLGNTTAFYDHSGYYTIDGTLVPDAEARDGIVDDGDPTDDALCGDFPPSPPATDPVTGDNSTNPNFNKFGRSTNSGSNTNTKCTGSFGDTKTLDLWTYRPSTPAQNNLVIVEFDHGDAPVSYDDTADDNDIIDENDNPAKHTPSANLYLGDVAADAEVAPQSSENADGDDNVTDADVDDEDGISDFPSLNISDDSYSLTATVNNTSGSAANIYAWIDFDRDGEFDEDERATVSDGTGTEGITLVSGQVPTGSSGTVTLNWNNLGTDVDITDGKTYLRLRMTTEDLDSTAETDTRDDASVGTASNGEVEDHLIAINSDDGNRPLGFSFTCDSTFYITIGDGGSSPQELYTVNRSGDTFEFVSFGTETSETGGYPTTFRYNALAYNPVDNYLYGMVQRSDTDGNGTVDPYDQNSVVKIGSDGVVHSLGIPEGSDGSILNSTAYFAATALSDGTYVIGRNNIFAKLDVKTSPPTILSQGTISGANFTDFAVDPTDPTSSSGARVYGIEENDDKLVVLDLTDDNFRIDSEAPNGTGFNHNTGSQFVDSFGTLYYRSNDSSEEGLYKVDSDPDSDTYGEAEFITTIQSGGNHDGASCLFASGMKKEVQDLNGNTITTIPAGETVNYIYSIASGNVEDLTGVTFEDDLRSVADGEPIDGRFTGNFTVSNGTGTVSFGNDNQTVQISGLTIPAQTQDTEGGEKVTITTEVRVSPFLATGDYYNQAFISNLPSSYPSILPSDYPPSASYEDPTPLSVTEALEPNLLLVKRITAINPGESDEIQFDSFVNDDSDNDGDLDNDPDNDPNWPDGDDTYLRGAINVTDIQPGDEVEYTIYFLSNGDEPATNIKICDVVPDNMTFVTNSYGSEAGMALALDETNLPTEPNRNLSNAADTDGGTFYAPGTAPPTVTFGDPPTERNLCSKVTTENTTVEVNATNNNNGAIVVEIDSLPEATDPGTPANSYGFVRFRAEIQ